MITRLLFSVQLINVKYLYSKKTLHALGTFPSTFKILLFSNNIISKHFLSDFLNRYIFFFQYSYNLLENMTEIIFTYYTRVCIII